MADKHFTCAPLTTPSVKASYSVLLANLTYTTTSPDTVKLMDIGEITKFGGQIALVFRFGNRNTNYHCKI